MDQLSEHDIDNLLGILDGFCEAGGSRMKIDMSEEVAYGCAKKEYHHGRCDVGSPWARGCSFDVLEGEDKEA